MVELGTVVSENIQFEFLYVHDLGPRSRNDLDLQYSHTFIDTVSSDSLLTKLGIQDLDVVLRTGRMRWFGHVECSTGWISEVCKLNVVAQKRSGRPRKSWDEVIKNDRKKLDMDSADPQNRSEWRGRL